MSVFYTKPTYYAGTTNLSGPHQLSGAVALPDGATGARIVTVLRETLAPVAEAVARPGDSLWAVEGLYAYAGVDLVVTAFPIGATGVNALVYDRVQVG